MDISIELAQKVINAQRAHLNKLNGMLMEVMAMINNAATSEDRNFTAQEALMRHNIYSVLFSEDNPPKEPGTYVVVFGDEEAVSSVVGPYYDYQEAVEAGLASESKCCWYVKQVKPSLGEIECDDCQGAGWIE